LAGDLSPRDVLLNVMRRHYRVKRYDEAARVASLVAPYIHPRLTATALTVKPSIAEIITSASDEELAEFAEEAERAADLAEDRLATVTPKGTA
jgi:hypothetical protein